MAVCHPGEDANRVPPRHPYIRLLESVSCEVAGKERACFFWPVVAPGRHVVLRFDTTDLLLSGRLLAPAFQGRCSGSGESEFAHGNFARSSRKALPAPPPFSFPRGERPPSSFLLSLSDHAPLGLVSRAMRVLLRWISRSGAGAGSGSHSYRWVEVRPSTR